MDTPPFVIIGYERAGLFLFDDSKILKKHKNKGPHKISQVEIQWNNEHITGVRFSYTDTEGETVKGQNITHFKPFQEFFGFIGKETFTIDDDDEIFEIYGRANNHINKLCFRTYNRSFCECGNEIGSFFSFKF